MVHPLLDLGRGPIQAAETPIVSMLQSWVMGWFQLAVGAYLIAILLIAAWSSDQSTGQLLSPTVLGLYRLHDRRHGWTLRHLGVRSGARDRQRRDDCHEWGVRRAGGHIVTDLRWSGEQRAGHGHRGHEACTEIQLHPRDPAGAVRGRLRDCRDVGCWLAVPDLPGLELFFGFLIAFGPVFVACYFFPFTRKFCDGWVRTVVAALVTQIFVAGLMSIFVLVITQFITQLSANMSGGGGGAPGGDIMNEVVNLLVMLAVFVMFVFLGFYLSRLAQSISGGAHAAFARVPSLRNPFRGGDKGGGGGGGNRGGGGSGQAGSGGQAPRQYAFNKSVGGSS